MLGLWIGLVPMVGCGQAPVPQPIPAATRAESLLQVHWAGKSHVLTQTNTTLAQVWSSPESLRLEAHVLEQLAHYWLRTVRLPTNAADVQTVSGLLRDVLACESLLAVRRLTNQPASLELALRLNDLQARHWQEQLTGLFGLAAKSAPPATAAGWSVFTIVNSNTLAHARINGWTLIKLNGQLPTVGAPADLLKRLQQPHPGTDPSVANVWLRLTTEVDWLAQQLGTPSLSRGHAPTLSLTVAPEGTDLRTRGTLDFAQPVKVSLPVWDIPTNAITGALSSFTAVRGLSNALADQPAWRGFNIGQPPGQLFSWAISGLLFQAALAFPDADAPRRLTAINQALLGPGNDWLGARGEGGFRPNTDATSAVWSGLPFVSPTALIVSNQSSAYVLASLMPLGADTNPFPAQLLGLFTERPKLLYYDWQLTGPRIESWMALSQLTRLTFRRSQLPADSASLLWMQSLIPRLGNTVTTVEAPSDRQWTFSRRSALGLSALEIHLLADWFEAPSFPETLRILEAHEPPVVLDVPGQ